MIYKALLKRNPGLWGAIICGLAISFYIYDYFIQVAPSVMTQSLLKDFQINAMQLGWLGSAFFFTYTLFQIPAGALLDRFGARSVLSIAVFCSALGVFLFSQAQHIELAALSRALVGAGSAFSYLGALFLISRWFEHRHFALISGFVQFGSAIGSIAGQAPFANLINHYGWRASMLTIGIISFILTILFWLMIRDSQDGKPIQKNHIYAEKISFRNVINSGQLWIISFCGYVAWVPASVFAGLWGIPYIMQAYHLQNEAAGSLFITFWLALGIGGPVWGFISEHFKTRKLPFIICFSLGLVSSIGILYAGDYPLWMLSIVLFGLGFATSIQGLSYGLVKDIMPAHHFATGSGVTNMLAVLSGATLQPFIGWMLLKNWDGAMHAGAPVYSTDAYRVGLSAIPVIIAIGLLTVIFFLKETHCRPQNS